MTEKQRNEIIGLLAELDWIVVPTAPDEHVVHCAIVELRRAIQRRKHLEVTIDNVLRPAVKVFAEALYSAVNDVAKSMESNRES